MADTAPASITFYEVPVQDAAGVVAWLNQWGLAHDDWQGGQHDHESVTLGVTYGDEQTRLSIVCAGHGGYDALAVLAPSSAWVLTQDARYEHDGQTVTHVPGLGARVTLSTQDGEEMFTRREVVDAVAAGTVAELLGTAWHDYLAALSERDGSTTVTPTGPLPDLVCTCTDRTGPYSHQTGCLQGL